MVLEKVSVWLKSLLSEDAETGEVGNEGGDSTGVVNNCVPRLSSYPSPLANNTVDPMSGIGLEPAKSNHESFLEGVQDRVRNQVSHWEGKVEIGT